jgi:hypothetical protein
MTSFEDFQEVSNFLNLIMGVVNQFPLISVLDIILRTGQFVSCLRTTHVRQNQLPKVVTLISFLVLNNY